MSERLIQVSTLTEIADAIREKKGTNAPILLTAFADEISTIETGGGGGGDGLPSGIAHAYFIQESANAYSLFLLPIAIEGSVVSGTRQDNAGNLEVTLNE